MASAPRVFTIPPHRAFADALAAGLMDGGGLERTLLLLPNRRAQRAMTEAFIRLSDGGLLLPRMLPIGDVGEDEALGLFDGIIGEECEVPPAIDAFARRMLLMQLVDRWRKRTGGPGAAVETLRLADALARTLDQMQLEGVDAKSLAEAGAELGQHWALTRDFLSILVDVWPKLLAARGETDRVARRQALLAAIARRWQAAPPPQRVVAAGIANADPAVAQLLSTIARMPGGCVVLPGVDLDTADWDALGRYPTHPQTALRRMLDRMGVARPEVQIWPQRSERDGPVSRDAALALAMALPGSSDVHTGTRFDGLSLADAATPAEEALVIALALRRQLETPGATAALVTPDRNLARRVAVQLGRWDVEVDDSAGTPLSRTPPGTLFAVALNAGAADFAPAELLALLKHPLAGPEVEAERLLWLDKVRALDLALRGVRPAAGLAGIGRKLAGADAALRAWWRDTEAQLRPIEKLLARPAQLDTAGDVLRDFANDFCGERIWRGAAGRAAGELIEGLVESGAAAGHVPPAELPALIQELAAGRAVRPPFGKHPRLAIYGLLEARLQRADLMILGGLNEGVWPAGAAFDPWLPPSIRRELGLPDAERSIGLAAHDFVMAAGAPQVLVTRARRDASAPAVPSRFWLRLKAFAGGELRQAGDLLATARAIDTRREVPRARRPAPSPPLAARPRKLSVTQVERLRADPFSFYAQKILGLKPLEALDADPGAADKGTLVHAMLEALIAAGTLHDASARRAVIEDHLATQPDQPMLAALWQPRVERMLEWAADTIRDRRAGGWHPTFSERKGTFTLAGVELTGKADIVQRSAAGVAIADFKTGRIPSGKQIGDGFALQLGLLALLAEAGSIEDIDTCTVTELAYWHLIGGDPKLGEAKTTTAHFKEHWSDVAGFVAKCRSVFEDVAAAYLTGSRPFEAKVVSEYARHYHDYDHLARLDEWQGRS